MHPDPVVAIIVPTLNRPHTLAPCLESIRFQRFTSYAHAWICIVVNQGEPVERSKDTRFIYVDLHRKSASHARNLGLHLARGLCVRYVCLVDDDDTVFPHYLDLMVGALDANPDATLAACNASYHGQRYRYDHPSTKLMGSRMVRESAIGDRRFEPRSGQEKVFWRLFDAETTIPVDELLYCGGQDPAGGLRDPEGGY